MAVNRERVQVICPACGQQVEALARDGRVKGYCAVAKQYVDFLIEAQRVAIDEHLTAETGAKIPAVLTQVREGRDSRGHFIKGNVPWNKSVEFPIRKKTPCNRNLGISPRR